MSKHGLFLLFVCSIFSGSLAQALLEQVWGNAVLENPHVLQRSRRARTQSRTLHSGKNIVADFANEKLNQLARLLLSLPHAFHTLPRRVDVVGPRAHVASKSADVETIADPRHGPFNAFEYVIQELDNVPVFAIRLVEDEKLYTMDDAIVVYTTLPDALSVLAKLQSTYKETELKLMPLFLGNVAMDGGFLGDGQAKALAKLVPSPIQVQAARKLREDAAISRPKRLKGRAGMLQSIPIFHIGTILVKTENNKSKQMFPLFFQIEDVDAMWKEFGENLPPPDIVATDLAAVIDGLFEGPDMAPGEPMLCAPLDSLSYLRSSSFSLNPVQESRDAEATEKAALVDKGARSAPPLMIASPLVRSPHIASHPHPQPRHIGYLRVPWRASHQGPAMSEASLVSSQDAMSDAPLVSMDVIRKIQSELQRAHIMPPERLVKEQKERIDTVMREIIAIQTGEKFASMKVAELRGALGELGLPTQGKKAELLQRLQGAAMKYEYDRKNTQYLDKILALHLPFLLGRTFPIAARMALATIRTEQERQALLTLSNYITDMRMEIGDALANLQYQQSLKLRDLCEAAVDGDTPRLAEMAKAMKDELDTDFCNYLNYLIEQEEIRLKSNGTTPFVPTPTIYGAMPSAAQTDAVQGNKQPALTSAWGRVVDGSREENMETEHSDMPTLSKELSASKVGALTSREENRETEHSDMAALTKEPSSDKAGALTNEEPSMEQQQWLLVLRCVRQGVYGMLSKDYEDDIKHIRYIIGLNSADARAELARRTLLMLSEEQMQKFENTLKRIIDNLSVPRNEKDTEIRLKVMEIDSLVKAFRENYARQEVGNYDQI